MKNIYILCCLFLIIACETERLPSNPPQILLFDFNGIKPVSIDINHVTKTISIILPYQTSLSTLVPQIETETGTTIIPASGIAQNFDKEVYYTLTKDKQKVIYTIKVSLCNQPKPSISEVKSDSTEAGFDFEVIGKNFGKFSLDIQAFLIDNTGKETLLKHQLIDSTQIRLTTSIEQEKGWYQVKLKVKNQETISTSKIWITYPAPQLTSLEKINLLNSDTLWLKGKYLDQNIYQYQLFLSKTDKSYFIDLSAFNNNKFGFILSKDVTIGKYVVQIYNKTLKQFSREENFQLEIYNSYQPFIKEIFNLKEAYKPNEKVVFKTLNFDKLEIRFFQVSLQGNNKTYLQNGIYDISKQTLSIELPNNIQAGNYSVSLSLISSNNKTNYSFNTDLQLTVKD
ncbi:hypothetical protein [Emticicia sp. SJ17W-69]|uniref:hypothetical protein n=1 Tax=Emticicia sp. SJ17W-69 TaxID=3421657 RepID=UPI003EBD2CA8